MPSQFFKDLIEQGQSLDETDRFILIEQVMRKYTENIEEDDGGERPFNEAGEVIEAIDRIIRSDVDQPARAGWFD